MSEENSSSPLDQSASPQPPAPQRVSVVAKLNLFLVAVFGSLLLTCCVGSWFLRKFDQTVEVTDAASVKEVLDSVPMIDLPSEFKPSKAVVKDSLFGGKAQVVEWKTPGGSRIIMGTIDIAYDEEADPGSMMKLLPIKNPIGISYDLLKEILPATSVEINGTIVQLRVVSINPQTREGSLVAVFPTKDKRTAVVFIESNANDLENLSGMTKMLETIR